MNDNYPQAYKTGSIDFYGRDFRVSPDVLIPRPESEMIIDAVLNLAGKPYLPGIVPSAAKVASSARILDVGTGSGCLATTLSLELDQADVTGVDISKRALVVAEDNCKRLGGRVKFFESDLIDVVSGHFDIIVANLPYVDPNWDWLDKNALSAEPSLALYAEDGGLFLIKRLIRELSERRSNISFDYLILESDPCQHEEIKKYASEFGLKHIETRGFVQVYFFSL